MVRKRLLMVLALAICAGSALALLTYRYIQQQPAAGPERPVAPVVVAAADLEMGSELRREDLRVIDWPADAVPAGAASDPQALVGRGLVQAVVQNSPILPGHMPPVEAGAGLPPIIPEGLRAVSVRVNDVISVAGYVLPGTTVDVVATVNPTTQQPDVTSKLILSNVQVLAAGTKIERESEDSKPVTVNVVTLLVSPAEAERLTLASTEGKIQLALRNPLDKSAPQTPGIRPAALLGAAPAARPVVRPRAAARQTRVVAAAADPIPTVEIIRGDKRAQEVVRQE
ncbi:MAG: Flp pilus assembly protein CpaB [Vicinamibacterales bacterium]